VGDLAGGVEQEEVHTVQRAAAGLDLAEESGAVVKGVDGRDRGELELGPPERSLPITSEIDWRPSKAASLSYIFTSSREAVAG
jgi:hypothetical protein